MSRTSTLTERVLKPAETLKGCRPNFPADYKSVNGIGASWEGGGRWRGELDSFLGWWGGVWLRRIGESPGGGGGVVVCTISH